MHIQQLLCSDSVNTSILTHIGLTNICCLRDLKNRTWGGQRGDGGITYRFMNQVTRSCVQSSLSSLCFAFSFFSHFVLLVLSLAGLCSCYKMPPYSSNPTSWKMTSWEIRSYMLCSASHIAAKGHLVCRCDTPPTLKKKMHNFTPQGGGQAEYWLFF